MSDQTYLLERLPVSSLLTNRYLTKRYFAPVICTKDSRYTIKGGIHFPVLEGVSLSVNPGDCVALEGASGSGKSTFMRSLYANYRVDSGEIWIRHRGQWKDIATAQAHELIDIRCYSLGYVSQFLRVIPRVSAIDVAAEPLVDTGV